MLTCIIVDDDNLAIAHLKRIIANRDDLHLVRSFTDAQEAIIYLDESVIDIVFLDIMMPKKTGIEVAKNIGNKAMIIFTTSSPKHALDAFNLEAIGYLIKPVLTDKFNSTIDKATTLVNGKKHAESNTENTSGNSINLISDRKSYKLQINEIIYLESLLEYVAYHTINSKIMCLGSLKKMLEELPENQFIRIQKSYAVNKAHIVNFTKVQVLLANNIELPIGRIYKDDFLKAMEG